MKFWYIILLVLVVLVVVLMSLCSSNKRNKSHRTNKNQSKKPRMKRTKSTVSSLSQKLKAKVLRNRHQRQSQHPSTSHHQHKVYLDFFSQKFLNVLFNKKKTVFRILIIRNQKLKQRKRDRRDRRKSPILPSLSIQSCR